MTCPGAISRLPYLQRLGIDAVWLNPFYPSPQADAGYDVADYRDVDPRFGTLDDADRLIAAAHDVGIRVIFDIVPNHTSDEHAWFRAAVAAGRDSPRAGALRLPRRPGQGRRQSHRTTGRASSAARRGRGSSSPMAAPASGTCTCSTASSPTSTGPTAEVHEEFLSILRFWFDRGVDGFRIDVAHGLAKEPGLPDLADRFPSGGPADAAHPHWDVDAVHDVYREWRRVSDTYDGDRAFVGEVWVATPERLARYLRADELHTAFNFDFLLASWDAAGLRVAIDQSIDALVGVGAPATWVLSNHDVVRHVTRYGGGELGRRRARAAALLMLALPGGAYVYQGEELGLEEILDLPDELREDPTFRRTEGAEKGRDGCRVPLPWSGTEPPFGFGPGPTTWLPQPAAWAELTAERQEGDPASMLSLYQRALDLRRQHPALGDGTMEWLDVGDDALAFRRQPGFTCVVNLGEHDLTLPDELVAGTASCSPASP